jgi:hypothetical protein
MASAALGRRVAIATARTRDRRRAPPSDILGIREQHVRMELERKLLRGPRPRRSHPRPELAHRPGNNPMPSRSRRRRASHNRRLEDHRADTRVRQQSLAPKRQQPHPSRKRSTANRPRIGEAPRTGVRLDQNARGVTLSVGPQRRVGGEEKDSPTALEECHSPRACALLSAPSLRGFSAMMRVSRGRGPRGGVWPRARRTTPPLTLAPSQLSVLTTRRRREARAQRWLPKVCSSTSETCEPGRSKPISSDERSTVD